jgi:hypothetical protein
MKDGLLSIATPEECTNTILELSDAVIEEFDKDSIDFARV